MVDVVVVVVVTYCGSTCDYVTLNARILIKGSLDNKNNITFLLFAVLVSSIYISCRAVHIYPYLTQLVISNCLLKWLLPPEKSDKRAHSKQKLDLRYA